MANAVKDNNNVSTLLGVSSNDNKTPIRLTANPLTGALLIDGTTLYPQLDTRYLKLDTSNDPLTGTLNIQVPTATSEALILQTTDDNATKNIFEVKNSGGTFLSGIDTDGFFRVKAEGGIRMVSSSGIVFKETTTSRIFRVLNFNTTWDDSSQSSFFQMGKAQGIISGNTGTVLTKFGISSEGMTIADIGYASLPSPNSILHLETDTASKKLLVLKAAASQTANLTEWQNSSGTPLTWVNSNGSVDILGAGDTTHGLGVDYEVSISSGGVFGADLSIINDTAGSGNITGFRGIAQANNGVGTSISGTVVGVRGEAWNNYGNLNLAHAGYFQVVANRSSGTITFAQTVRIETPLATGNITNAYGLFVRDINTATTLNYAIYTNAGDNRFGDDVILNGADSDKLWFGAGKDMSLYYDGTSGYIKTSEVAASDLHVTCGTAKTLVLDTPVYNDMQWEISSGRVGVANFPDWVQVTTNIYEYAFDVNDYIDLNAEELPHNWVEGGNVDLHLHVATDAANTSGSSQYAKFTLYVAYSTPGTAWTETPFTAELTIPNGTGANVPFLLDMGNLDLTGFGINTHLKVRVKRIAATGGTEYADHIFIHQVGGHVLVDTLGSRTESTK